MDATSLLHPITNLFLRRGLRCNWGKNRNEKRKFHNFETSCYISLRNLQKRFGKHISKSGPHKCFTNLHLVSAILLLTAVAEVQRLAKKLEVAEASASQSDEIVARLTHRVSRFVGVEESIELIN